MTNVIECTEGHYEMQRTSYGEAYVWRPDYVVVKCDCGERLYLTAFATRCRCGLDHAVLVRKELASGRLSERSLHPWDQEYYEWRKTQEKYLRSESHDWVEWQAIE